MSKTQNQFLPEDILIPFFGKDSQIIGVEIGVLGASGTVAMLNRMPNLTVVGIDPWMHFEGKAFEAERDQQCHDEMYQHSLNRVKEFGDRCTLLRMTSDKALEVFADESLDFVWIDGDHEEAQVLKDISQWKSKIKKSKSLIGGHDYQISYIARIAKEQLGEVETGEDFTWWKKYE